VIDLKSVSELCAIPGVGDSVRIVGRVKSSKIAAARQPTTSDALQTAAREFGSVHTQNVAKI